MPKQEKEFQVQFMPKNKRYFSGKIYFHVGETKFSHKLIGFGGAAECILMNPKLKLLQNTQYCLRPKDPTSFDLTVNNVGDRASFMHIVAVNSRGEILDEVKFSHQRFCLNHGLDRVEKTVKITVPQSVLTSIEERPNIVSQSSAGYSTKNPNEKYLFDLKIYWGEERLRQRAKKYILLEKMSHPKIGDIYCTRDVYTANNDKEVQLLENMDLTIQDVEMLKAQTRMFTVKIYDGRVNTQGCSPLKFMMAESIPAVPRHVSNSEINKKIWVYQLMTMFHEIM
uniref:Uncharacterized protein n=1 Tax=Panagrolaimus sp. JU765 TaxID=591449 RepID=A0AC34QQ71_9BILA